MAQGRSIPPIPTIIEGSGDPRALDDPGWSGTFLEFLNVASVWPAVARTTVQRLYDRVAESAAPAEIAPDVGRLLPALRAAADGLLDPGIPIVLEGPAERSTAIAGWLARELSDAARTREGAIFSYLWPSTDGEAVPCPIGEDPLHLIPPPCRDEVVREIQREQVGRYPVAIRGGLCPTCAERLRASLYATGGDWSVGMRDVRVVRLLLDPDGGRGWLRLSEPPPGSDGLAAANRGILLAAGAAGASTLAALRSPSAPWDLLAIIAIEGDDGVLDPEVAAAVRRAGSWIAIGGAPEGRTPG